MATQVNESNSNAQDNDDSFFGGLFDENDVPTYRDVYPQNITQNFSIATADVIGGFELGQRMGINSYVGSFKDRVQKMTNTGRHTTTTTLDSVSLLTRAGLTSSKRCR